MAINKVVYGNNTLIDLTSDTVDPNNLLSGYTAHDRSGATIAGAVVVAEVIDNLTTDDGTKALSAKQGKILNDTKQNNIWVGTQAEYTAQAANIPDGTFVDITDDPEAGYGIVDNLTTQDATLALSAKQGYVLKGLIDAIPTPDETWTSAVSGSIGDESITFTNTKIHTTSVLDLYSENVSGTPVIYTNITISEGSVTYSIPALTEATNFKLWIRNL